MDIFSYIKWKQLLIVMVLSVSIPVFNSQSLLAEISAPTASQPAIQLLLLSGNAVVLSGRIEQSEERQALAQSTTKLQRVATVKADAPSAISPLLRDADEIWLARLNVDVLNYGDAIDGYFPISKTIIPIEDDGTFTIAISDLGDVDVLILADTDAVDRKV